MPLPNVPLWSPRFRVEGDELQYKPFPAYPTWLVAWSVNAGGGELFGVPASPLLDNFNRPDEATVSGNWQGDVYSIGRIAPKLQLQRLIADSLYPNALWYSPFTGDAEVYVRAVTVPTSEAIVLFLHWTKTGVTDEHTGYALSIYTDYWMLDKVDINDNRTTIWDWNTTDVLNGSEMLFRSVGADLLIYHKPYQGVYTLLDTIAENSYRSGKIGIELSDGWVVDDFGGGNLIWTIPDVILSQLALLAFTQGAEAYLHSVVNSAALNTLVTGLQSQINAINTQIINIENRLDALENP